MARLEPCILRMPADRNGRLTPRQARFVEAYLAHGADGAAAVRALGFKGQRAANVAWGLKRSLKVMAEIERRQGELARCAQLCLEERLEILAEIARDGSQAAGDRIRAIAELNKLEGSYAPIRSQTDIRQDGRLPLFEAIKRLLAQSEGRGRIGARCGLGDGL